MSEDSKKITIKCLRPFLLPGARREFSEKNETYSVPKNFGLEMCLAGKAELVNSETKKAASSTKEK